jgi:hypothetical protein
MVESEEGLGTRSGEGEGLTVIRVELVVVWAGPISPGVGLLIV